MNLVAEGTKNVEDSYFQDDGFPSPSVFDMFINRNKWLMRSITILNLGSNPCHQSDVDEMVEMFLRCPGLQYLSMREIPAVTIVETLQCRGVPFMKSL